MGDVAVGNFLITCGLTTMVPTVMVVIFLCRVLPTADCIAFSVGPVIFSGLGLLLVLDGIDIRINAYREGIHENNWEQSRHETEMAPLGDSMEVWNGFDDDSDELDVFNTF